MRSAVGFGRRPALAIKKLRKGAIVRNSRQQHVAYRKNTPPKWRQISKKPVDFDGFCGRFHVRGYMRAAQSFSVFISFHGVFACRVRFALVL
jgi:hypothetical protein